jgi:hypothetical protein
LENSQLREIRYERLKDLPSTDPTELIACNNRCCSALGGICSRFETLTQFKQKAGALIIAPANGRRILPSIDYNRLFLTPDRCPARYRVRVDPEGIQSLSPSSTIAPYSCLHLTHTGSSERLIENIEMTEQLLTAHGRGIYSSGFVRIKEVRLTEVETTILSGGDLQIGTISSSASENFNLLLYSATGSILVEQPLAENISVTALSKLGGNLPEGIHPQLDRLLPVLQWEISGLGT